MFRKFFWKQKINRHIREIEVQIIQLGKMNMQGRADGYRKDIDLIKNFIQKDRLIDAHQFTDALYGKISDDQNRMPRDFQFMDPFNALSYMKTATFDLVNTIRQGDFKSGKKLAAVAKI